jgi:hypothetical protein
VLRLGVTLARQLWPERLLAAYALGSLAHGGFSEHVSDVDLGLVLAHPLRQADAHGVARICRRAAASGLPLAARLSIFWASPQTLAGELRGGRFPPVDLCDLRRSGRLLHGRDLRDGVSVPSPRQLFVSSAAFALERLATPEVVGRVLDPARLAASDVRTLTKLVLFPVRLLFTARTGEVGLNTDSARHFARNEPGELGSLALAAIEWRNAPPRPADAEALLRTAMAPLYRRFVRDFERRLSRFGEPMLARSYRDWRERLG